MLEEKGFVAIITGELPSGQTVTLWFDSPKILSHDVLMHQAVKLMEGQGKEMKLSSTYCKGLACCHVTSGWIEQEG